MAMRNTEASWGWVSIALHWLVVVLLLCVAVIGLVMGEMPNSLRKLEVYALHKSLGLSILGLMALRLVWRLFAGRPRAVPGTPRWQARVADATHWMLYAALFAMPISGWLYNSASNFPLRWFGLFSVPAISERDPGLKELALDAHQALFVAIVVLVVLHAGAALWHHLVQRDATLQRMLPLLRPGAGAAPPEDRT